MKINKVWHLANKMPKNPTHEERMRWHVAHNRKCQCHPASAKLQSEIEEFLKKKGKKR
ncbi:MAG: hypothetical protein HYT87_15910 [Nitrospirae bacterium]|nr:hypothetical protein [Nitrospirota bacterium]